MNEMTYTKKEIRNTFDAPPSSFWFQMDKPTICPVCNAYVDSTKNGSRLFTQSQQPHYGVVQYRCQHCGKLYLVVYEIDTEQRTTRVSAFLPSRTANYQNEVIENISEGFIRYYNQAARAEAAGDNELAATGYRMALEHLVKDYAINELHKDREEVVSKTLFSAIGDYLGEHDLIATADVVRILGNDYVHYERRYPEHDLSLMKRYLEIFIRLVETKYLIAHPPLGR